MYHDMDKWIKLHTQITNNRELLAKHLDIVKSAPWVEATVFGKIYHYDGEVYTEGGLPEELRTLIEIAESAKDLDVTTRKLEGYLVTLEMCVYFTMEQDKVVYRGWVFEKYRGALRVRREE